MNLIKNIELKNNNKKINNLIIEQLWELVRNEIDIYIIREEYKKILE